MPVADVEIIVDRENSSDPKSTHADSQNENGSDVAKEREIITLKNELIDSGNLHNIAQLETANANTNQAITARLVEIEKLESIYLPDVIERLNTEQHSQAVEMTPIGFSEENRELVATEPSLLAEELALSPNGDIDRQIEQILAEPEELAAEVEVDVLQEQEPWVIGFKEEVDEFWREVLEKDNPEPTEEAAHFESEFTEQEAEEIDLMLRFEEVASQETKNVTADELDGDMPSFAEKVATAIDETFIYHPEKTEELKANLAKIEELVDQIIDAEYLAVEAELDESRAYALHTEIEEIVQKFLADLGKEPDQKMIKRFVERIIESKLQKVTAAIAVDEEPEEGTHEKKLALSQFMQDLTDDFDAGSRYLLTKIGRFALAQQPA